MRMPPRHPAGQGSGTTATRARGGPGGCPQRTWPPAARGRSFPPRQPPGRRLPGCTVSGATALSRLWALPLGQVGSALPRVQGAPASWERRPAGPCRARGRVWNLSLRLDGGGQGPGQDGGQTACHRCYGAGAPSSACSLVMVFGDYLKGLGPLSTCTCGAVGGRWAWWMLAANLCFSQLLSLPLGPPWALL